ncbi:MAG: RNA polymerase sigma factor [Clostridia bacterium]|nr:RNA polymerase sigma factor [Clostridia bacterium]
MVPNTTLDKWLEEISKGDQSALESLYNETRDALYAYSLSITHNKVLAEDALQDTYIAVFEKADTYQKRNKPLAWLFTIAKNVSLSKLRKNKEHINIDDLSEILGAKEGNIEDRLFLSYLFKHVSQDERDICILHSVAGFKHREIARFMEMPLGTVLAKYRRTMKKLKEIAKEAQI